MAKTGAEREYFLNVSRTLDSNITHENMPSNLCLEPFFVT